MTKGAGKAPLDVTFSSSVKDFDVIDNYDYSHTVKYTPVQQVRSLQRLHSTLEQPKVFPIIQIGNRSKVMTLTRPFYLMNIL